MFESTVTILSAPYLICWLRKVMVIQSNILNGMDRTALADLKIKFEYKKAEIVAWFLGVAGFKL